MKRALPFVILLSGLSCQGASRSTAPSEPLSLPAGSLRVSVPARASEAVHIERDAAAFLEVRALDVGDAPARRVDARTVVYERAGTRITQVSEDGRVEELRHVERDAHSLAYEVRLGPGLSRLRVVDDIVEALDARGVALLRTEPAFLVDALGRRRDLHPSVARDGETWSLRWPIDDTGLVHPLDIDPAWTVTTSLAKARRNDTLHLLSSGKVLALGGATAALTNLSSVEAWDPVTKSWTSAGTTLKPRAYHTAATLPDGRIVAAGGFEPGTASTAEIFDPTSGTSTAIAASAPRPIGLYARSLALSATQVFMTAEGGCVLLDVSTGSWTDAPYVVDHGYGRIALLPSGKVLVVGGDVTNAEVFDPSTKAWKAVAPTKVARKEPEIVTLSTGKVLVASGWNTSAELYDPSADTWTLTPPLTTEHAFAGMVLLSTGKALLMAGDVTGGLTDRTELYDPVANAWSFAGRLLAPLDDFGYVALPGGKALVAGGSNGVPIATTQLFEPQPSGKACVGPGECASGFCVDGACCDKSACATGETCGGSGAPGTCLKRDATSCSKDDECGSGHCVDGVCCNSACTEVCGACNVKGSEGVCSPIPAGEAPRAPRADCPGAGACRARCGGVDATKCTQFPGTPVVCAPPTCKDGQETSAQTCDGAGACAASTPHACAPYACGTTACLTQCGSDADCVEGNSCDLVSRKCVIAAACEGDEAVKSPDGVVTSCVPYRCASGRCVEQCTDSSSCANGYLCDVGSGHCVLAAPSPGSSDGGCTFGRRDGESWSALVLAALLWSTRRGRRRRRSD